MGGYFNRGASAGGHDEGYFDRKDITGPSGVGSKTGGPGGVGRENDEVPEESMGAQEGHSERRIDETAGSTDPGDLVGAPEDIAPALDQ